MLDVMKKSNSDAWHVWVLHSRNDFNLKLKFVVCKSLRDFYIEIFCSNHFYINISKYRFIYIQYTSFNYNQFI